MNIICTVLTYARDWLGPTIPTHNPEPPAVRTPAHARFEPSLTQKPFFGKVSSAISEAITKEAKALLRFSSWNIAEIAYSLGFEHASNFIIFFKKQTNITPLQFRKTIEVT